MTTLNSVVSKLKQRDENTQEQDVDQTLIVYNGYFTNEAFLIGIILNE